MEYGIYPPVLMVLSALGDTPEIAEEALRPVGRPGAVGMEEAMVMVMGTTGPLPPMDALVDAVALAVVVPLMGKGAPVSG